MPPIVPNLPAPGLFHMGSYVRDVAAPLERVLENALDWEHLPWLHSQDFSSVELYQAGDWGWQARVGWEPPERGMMEFELLLNDKLNAWVSRNSDNIMAGEIWSYATATKPARTRVDIQFWAPEAALPHAEHLVTQYTILYKRLWDQEEEMSRARFLRLNENAVRRKPRAKKLQLGTLDELRQRLPLVVEMNDQRYRLVQLNGDIIVHSAICPHLLGPLENTEIVDGCITCPWHGYRYNVRTGASADEHDLKMFAPPELRIDAKTQRVELYMAAKN
jgi:nitrite reductase/ring-hydroxylating ferredoxin subunit